MEPKISMPCSQKSAACPYPEPARGIFGFELQSQNLLSYSTDLSPWGADIIIIIIIIIMFCEEIIS